MKGKDQHIIHQLPALPNRKLIMDPTIAELQRVCFEILLPDENKVIQRALEKIDRDRTTVDVAHHLRERYGMKGQDLELATLKILETAENFYSKKPTLSTIQAALYSTQYAQTLK